jgi:protein-disulfide isomerase
MRANIRSAYLRWGRWFAPPLLVLGAFSAWFAFDPGLGGMASHTATAVASDTFERRVRDYLLRNPEVIMEALQSLEIRRRVADESEAQQTLKSNADAVLHDAASPVGGNMSGDVTMVEFFDYNCAYCRKVERIVLETEASDPKLRIVYKEFPILGPNSVFAAKAALASYQQGRYAQFHKALMQVHGVVDEAATFRVAKEVGLDIGRLKIDMADTTIQGALDRNLALAQALRLAGTPGFVIGDQILRGATDAATLRSLIAKARSSLVP